MGMITIYNLALGGCTGNGFATLQRGCTLWLDVLLGFVIVLSVAVIGPNRWRLQFWGFAVVALVASIGGLSAISSGDCSYVFSDPAGVFFYWQGAGLATFLGGLLGLAISHLLLHIRSEFSRRRHKYEPE